MRRQGLYAYYRLADESVVRVLWAMQRAGEARLLEIQQVVHTYLKQRETMEAVTAGELARRLEEGSVIVLDVRPVEEYHAGHIPGALCVPLAELKQRLKELPRKKEIVAYCRGPYCVQSDTAIEILANSGFKARRLGVGLPDWRINGFPIESALK